MASITITIPDPVLTRVLDAIASIKGYSPARDGTKAQFAKAQLILWLKNMVLDYEANNAAENAAASARATANSEIAIT